MNAVTVATVEHVARLARLTLTDEEKKVFARQLGEILAWAESLQDVEIADVPPMRPTRPTDASRSDTPAPGTEHEDALAQAPDAADGLFRVPRVIG